MSSGPVTTPSIPNGWGTHTFPTGDTYAGNFLNGQFHGEGTITWASTNNSLTGIWVNGNFDLFTI